VTEYRLVSEPQADLDIEGAFQWYEREQPGLGLDFLDELRAAYDRIVEGPLKYQHLRSGVRRALLRRFPYAVYFAVEQTVIVVLAVLHVSRDPAE
jgi:plasmid stabilization system protein ParE